MATNKNKEALRLALEALVAMSPSGPTGSLIWHQQMYAITALREALAEQPAPVAKPHEQEPEMNTDISYIMSCSDDEFERVTGIRLPEEAWERWSNNMDKRKDELLALFEKASQPAQYFDEVLYDGSSTAEALKRFQENVQPAQPKYCRGDRLICLETEEYCVIHISGTDRQWVKFPDTHIGVYKNEQLAELFELLPKEIEIEQPAQRERVVFPTMLRKMWSGGEVQAWLDENVNKENT